MHDSLPVYLNENNLLHRTQSGFRSQRSCETALVHMIDSWLNAMDNGELVGIVLVDFKKAFALMDHQIILSKLKLYGTSSEALMWFDTLCKSDFQKKVTCGVPQGSILGPLLFLLFINDLPLDVDNISADLYADDTTLYAIQTSLEAMEVNL